MTGRSTLATAVGIAWVLLVTAGTALGADPTATPETAGDPRSSGQGPGFVGAPLLAIGLVLGIAVVAVLATWVYVRMTGGARQD